MDRIGIDVHKRESQMGSHALLGPRHLDVRPILRRRPGTPHPRWSRRHSADGKRLQEDRQRLGEVQQRLVDARAATRTKTVSIQGQGLREAQSRWSAR
jgi:hypothetical protein